MISKKYYDAKQFEKEAFEFLKTKFEKVEWASEFEPNAKYDFICSQYGKIFYGDAKNGDGKPQILPSQKEVDFIVFKRNEEIKLLFKEEFKDKVSFPDFKIIKIKEETKNKLDKLKVHYRETYDDIINKLISKEKNE